MSVVVLLDAGPLGLATNPRGLPEAALCNQWLQSLLMKGVSVLVPEIADYEVRRELLRIGSGRAIAKLDQLKATISYLPITTDAMLQAAEFWAQARQQGQPTAADKALDADVILAAQAITLAAQGNQVTVATTNVGHLARFVSADLWQNIS